MKFRQHGGMWSGELERLLHFLNPRLTIFRGNKQENHHRAGIYCWQREWKEDEGFTDYRIDGNWKYKFGCGVGWIPERSRWDAKGHIVTRGWREVLWMLANQGEVRIPAQIGYRENMLEPHISGYPIIVNQEGRQIGIFVRK